MHDVEALQKFYGAGSKALWTELLESKKEGPEVWQVGELAALVFTKIPDLVTGNSGTPDPYIAFDEVLSLEHLSKLKGLTALPNIRWEEKALPKLMFDLQTKDYETYRRQVRTKNKFTNGSVWNAVARVEKEISEEEAFQIVERKRVTYPDTSWELVKFTREYLKGALLVVEGHVEGQMIYELLCVVGSGTMCGLIAVTTSDTQLRKNFSPYTLAHMHALQLGYAKGCDVADFGMFFDYKAIFGQPPVWYPGLRYIEKADAS